MAEVEYVLLERGLYRAVNEGEDMYSFVPDPNGTYEFWQEISRVTAARKSLVLRDHTPENGVFNAIPAADWDAAVEVGTENIPKRTLTPVKERAKRSRKKKAEAEAEA